MRGFFVAGTDTGVGKTQVARALCALLRERGLKPVPLKPVETGCEPDSPEDALALRAACGGIWPLDQICPYRFRMPAAPLVAADAEGREIDLLRIEEIAARSPTPLIVEAAGGLVVPIARAPRNLEQTDAPDAPPSRAILTNLDLAERLALPVVLVGRAGLGTLNHTALSAEALERRGLTIAAIVLNRTAAQDDPSVQSNARWVSEMTGARVIGPLPFVAAETSRPEALKSALDPLLLR
jgi:dethiobiotin synthetase